MSASVANRFAPLATGKGVHSEYSDEVASHVCDPSTVLVLLLASDAGARLSTDGVAAAADHGHPIPSSAELPLEVQQGGTTFGIYVPADVTVYVWEVRAP